MFVYIMKDLANNKSEYYKLIEDRILPLIQNKELNTTQDLKIYLEPILEILYKRRTFYWRVEICLHKTFYIHISKCDQNDRLSFCIIRKKLNSLQKICLWNLSNIIKNKEDIEKLSYFKNVPNIIKHDIQYHSEKSNFYYD